ncbi:MAG: mechanosensitive ion channel family protein, partial [Planctomycetota bacterium]
MRTSLIRLCAIAALLLPRPGDAARAQTTPEDPALQGERALHDAGAGFDSPSAAMFAFIEAMEELRKGRSGALRDAYRSMRFPDGEPDSARQAYAADLLYVLNRVGPVQRTQFAVTDRNETRFTYFPRPERMPWHAALAHQTNDRSVVLSKESDGWRFTKETIEGAQAFARELEEFAPNRGGMDVVLTPGARLRAMVPEQLKGPGHTLLTLEYWEWLFLLVIVVTGMALDLIVRFVLTGWWHRYERSRGQEVDDAVLKRAVRPFGMLAAAVLWHVVLDQGLVAASATGILTIAVRVILAFSAIWAAFNLTDLLAAFASRHATKSDTKFDDLLVPLLQRAAKVFLAAMGLIYVANAFSIEIMPLLTGLGIGGLAVAFAAKDTIENFFGSVSVILDRPFEIGDWIVVNDVEGTVEDLGFRSTRIRTFYNSLVTMPNASLVRARVDNYGRRRYRRYKTTLNLTYGTSPERLDAYCAGVRELIVQHPYTRKDYYHVWVNGLGAHSVDVLVYMFFECPDWAIELLGQPHHIQDEPVPFAQL